MRELLPTCRPVDDATAIYDGLEFPVLPARPYVVANMVASVDGKAQIGTSAAGLGGPIDHALLVRLRALADGVLVGAGTVRADRVYGALPPELVTARKARGQSPEPRWIVASQSGNVPSESPLFQRPQQRTIVLTSETIAAERRAALARQGDVLPLPGQTLDLRAGFGQLRQRYSIRHLLCEGGPSFLHSLLSAGLLDELFLTLAPKLAGGDVKTIVEGPALGPPLPALDLLSLYADEGELYLRYHVRMGKGAAGAPG